jgi:hypothetical protein
MSRRYEVLGSGYPQKVAIYDTHRDKTVFKLPNKTGKKKLRDNEFIEYKSFNDVMNYMEGECARLNNEYEDDLLYLEIVENYSFTFWQKLVKRSKRMFTNFVNFCKMVKGRGSKIGMILLTAFITMILMLVQKEIDKQRRDTL